MLFTKHCVIIQLSLLFACTISVNGRAQTSYPKGAYLSLEELRTKSPSLDPNVEIDLRSGADKAMMGGNDFKITSPDQSVGKREIKMEWVAYSDGQVLYLNGFPFEIQSWYCKVESEGGLLLFKGAMKNNDAAAIAVATGAIGSAAVSGADRLYILDLRNMEVQQSDKKRCAKYLQSFPAILDEYNTESRTGDADTQLKYLTRINGGIDGTQLIKNSSYQLELTEAKPVYLVIYRRSRKELNEPVSLVIQDSAIFEAMPDSYWWNKYSSADSILSICWNKEEDKHCQKIDVTDGGTFYVSVSKDEKSQVISVQYVEDGEGEWDSELARKAQLKREK